MAHSIIHYPDPRLRKPTKEVTDFGNDLSTLIAEMVFLMKEADGVGLAAPQIGEPLRLAVVLIEDQLYVLANPEIIEEEGTQTDEEGCLSFPGIYGDVTRPMKIKVRAQNEKGETMYYEAEGFVARAFCHEIDHLSGKLLLDKFSPMKREMINKRLQKEKANA